MRKNSLISFRSFELKQKLSDRGPSASLTAELDLLRYHRLLEDAGRTVNIGLGVACLLCDRLDPRRLGAFEIAPDIYLKAILLECSERTLEQGDVSKSEVEEFLGSLTPLKAAAIIGCIERFWSNEIPTETEYPDAVAQAFGPLLY